MRVLAMLALSSVFLSTGCISMQPFVLNAQAERIQIAESEKSPLRVAVFIPDPMAFRMLMTTKASNMVRDITNNTRDMSNTRDSEGMFPLTRELVKVSADTFPQVFREADVVRRLPEPGEYDAVIQYSISEVNVLQFVKVGFGTAKSDLQLAMRWEVSVLDKKNVEVLSKKDLLASETVRLKTSLSTKPFFDEVGRLVSAQLPRLTKDIALTLHSAPEVRALTVKP